MKLRIGPAELLLLLAASASMNVDGATSSICPPQIVWDRVYGGTDYDSLGDIATTGDGGFIAAGSSYSSASSHVPGALGGFDALVVRTDATGAQIWRRFYGGTSDDGGKSLAAMDDGGFILGANSSSPTNGMKTGAAYGGADYWLVRLGHDGSV
ncbi:MAG TPA: hypothetical protein VJS65_14750, partial [Verrucomicrobiae bacterium]|nr:hypothetical protein [Verrucomicrobiae bacterium]